MIVLTSSGLENEALHTIIKNNVKKSNFKHAVIVTTADNIYKEKNWNIKRLTQELEATGLNVTLFDFDADSLETLKQADVIELNGGNPYYLLDRIKKAEVQNFFKDFAKTNILIGISAGSLVMQKNISLINQLTPEMNIVNLSNLNALDLINVEILPHFNTIKQRFPNVDVDRVCLEYEAKIESPVYKLNNTEGIIKYPNDDTISVFKVQD